MNAASQNRRAVGVLFGLGVAFCVTDAGAQDLDAVASDLAAPTYVPDWDFRYQQQIGLVRGGNLPSGKLGLLELTTGGSVWGIGGSAGLGFERIPYDLDQEELFGAYLRLSFETRPFAYIDPNVFRWIDPVASAGFRIGAVGGEERGEEIDVRAAATLGFGVDIGLAYDEIHPAIVLRYRIEPITTPVDGPEHFVLFGIAIRAAK